MINHVYFIAKNFRDSYVSLQNLLLEVSFSAEFEVYIQLAATWSIPFFYVFTKLLGKDILKIKE